MIRTAMMAEVMMIVIVIVIVAMMMITIMTEMFHKKIISSEGRHK